MDELSARMIALQAELRKAQRGEKVLDTIHKNVNELLLLHNKKHEDRVGFYQKQLASAINVSYSTINRWENGHVVPSNLAVKSFYDFCENNFITIPQNLL